MRRGSGRLRLCRCRLTTGSSSRRCAGIMARRDWSALSTVFSPDAVLEFPRVRRSVPGLQKHTRSVRSYPDLDRGEITAIDVASEQPTYALAPTYTVVSVAGSGDAATATFRVGTERSLWWVVIAYQSDGERIGSAKAYFAPDFEPPRMAGAIRESR